MNENSPQGWYVQDPTKQTRTTHGNPEHGVSLGSPSREPRENIILFLKEFIF